jgi:HPt (histidine-containing phosphotransfer) domain-containing protein
MVDLAFLRKFTKDDPIKMKRYISLYLEVAPNTFKEMQENLKNGDWEQLRINAHSLKPQADFMGIKSLKEELIKIEEAVRLNNLGVIEELFKAALNISNISEKMLKERLDQL